MNQNLFNISAIAILLLAGTLGCKKEIHVTGVTFDESEMILTVGETETLTATVLPSDATNKAVSWTSNNTTVADVSNGMVTAKEPGTATITVITADGNYTAQCTITVIPVEKGVVIRGVRWATRNVGKPGTFVAHPEDAGMLYQWNKKVGWSATDPMINSKGGDTWDDSKAAGKAWTKENDPCPKGWRVPTHKEQELLTYVDHEWTTLNGVNGRSFGSGDNTLFLPAAGSRIHSTGELTFVGVYGYYWSCHASNGTYGEYLYIHSSNIYPDNSTNKASGFSIRCVAE